MFSKKVKKANIALVYFGQPRFTNNFLSLPSQYNKIYKKYKTDVFAYLWYAENVEYDKSNWTFKDDTKRQKNIVHENAINHLKKYYKNIDIRYETPRKFEPHIQIPIEKIIAINVQKNVSNILSQLYIFQKAGDYLNQKSDISKYDFIVILRTDLCIRKFPNLNNLTAGFYISSVHKRFPDLIYIFSPTFLKFTKAFDNLKSLNWSKIDEFIPELLKQSSYNLEFPGFAPIPLSNKLLNVEIINEQFMIFTIYRKIKIFIDMIKNKFKQIIKKIFMIKQFAK